MQLAMFVSEELSLLEEFTRNAAAVRRKKLWDIEDSFQRAADRQRQEKRERKEREAMEAMLATPAQLAAFHDRLDRYDTAIVAALMDNEAARAGNRAKMQDMLSQAYVLPDGRRAFRSEDGQRVIDEHGAAVSHDEVHPDMIPANAPTGEAYLAGLVRQHRLDREQAQLLQYQARVDQARTSVGDKPSTAAELDGLDADLKEAMPDAVRRHLPGNTPDPRATTPETSTPGATRSGARFGAPAL